MYFIRAVMVWITYSWSIRPRLETCDECGKAFWHPGKKVSIAVCSIKCKAAYLEREEIPF